MCANMKYHRRVKQNRLVYYQQKADPQYWDDHWKNLVNPEYYQWASKGELGCFAEIFSKYLPHQGKILEAGCGTGIYVIALRARGYDIEGIEWGEKTVKLINDLYPSLPVKIGDVTRLNVPDEYYSAYISLGVVEHFQDGPEPFLREAYRILSSEGVALISVPYFNGLRRVKALLGLYRYSATIDLEFYQYAFFKKEFSLILAKNGFDVIDYYGYDACKCLDDEIPIIQNILALRFVGWRIRNRILSSHTFNQKLGHMLMFICKKKASA